MSYEMDTLDVTLLAAGDLSTYQYKFVKLSADNTVTYAGAGEAAIGVLQNKPSAAGQAARVRVFGVTRVVGGVTIAYGDKVGVGASALGAVMTANKDIYLGICIEGTGTWSATQVATVLLSGQQTLSA